MYFLCVVNINDSKRSVAKRRKGVFYIIPVYILPSVIDASFPLGTS